MCHLSDYAHLSIVEPWKGYLSELPVWHRTYLPVHGTVLDAGAGCGETTQFFLLHGARHVIAIEKNPVALRHLYANFDQDPRVTIVPFGVESWKIDCEGSEWGMVIETHNKYPKLKQLKQWGGSTGIYRLSPSVIPNLSVASLKQTAKNLIILQGKYRRRLLNRRE